MLLIHQLLQPQAFILHWCLWLPVNLHPQILYSKFLSVSLHSSKAQIISPLFTELLIYQTIIWMKSKTALTLWPTKYRLCVLVPRTHIIFGSVLFISQCKVEKKKTVYVLLRCAHYLCFIYYCTSYTHDAERLCWVMNHTAVRSYLNVLKMLLTIG